MTAGRRRLVRAGLVLAQRLEARAARRAGRRPAKPVRLTVVFLQWDPSAGPAAFAALDRRVAGLAGMVARRVIVDNAATGPVGTGRDGEVPVVPGDNRAREFSGWQRGIEHARADGDTDVWLLANDRFDTCGYPFLERLSAGAVHTARALQAVVGRVDHYPGPVESFGLNVSSWVNTALYLVPDPVLERVGGPVFLHPGNLDEVMPADHPEGSSPFHPGGPVGALHGHHLVAFLGHAPDAPHGAHWYRRVEPLAATWPEFRGKVMSILNEQLFSAKARAAGAPLLEMGLAGRLGAMGVENPAVRDAFRRIALDPAAEPLRLNRVSTRVGLALRALIAPLPAMSTHDVVAAGRAPGRR